MKAIVRCCKKPGQGNCLDKINLFVPINSTTNVAHITAIIMISSSQSPIQTEAVAASKVTQGVS